MKQQTLRKVLAVLLSALMLVSVLPMSAMAATNEDWQVEDDYVILAGQDLIDASGTTNIGSSAIVSDAGRTYVKYNATVGTQPIISIQQKKSGINLAEYDYYVFSYYQSDSAWKLDTTFTATWDASAYERGSEWLWTFYEQWSINNHPAGSNGVWTTKTMTRAEFYGCKPNNTNPEHFAPVPALANQTLRFKPWVNNATDGSYFGLEYVALFKTEAEAAAFVEMQSAGLIPVTSMTVSTGSEADTVETSIGNTVPVKVIVEPAYAASAVSVSVEGDSVTFENGVFKATKSGKSTVTVTANADIEGAEVYTDSFEIDVVAPSSVVIAGSSLYGNVSTSVLSMSHAVVDDDTLGKRLLKSTVTASTAGGDNSHIQYNLASFNVLAAEFPYVKIGYVAKTTNATYTDINTGVTGYRPGGTGTATSNRLWGPKPTTVQETAGEWCITPDMYTSSEKSWDTTTNPWTDLGYDWSYINSTGIYNYLRLKPWPSSSASNAVDDYFAVEYIAFFSSETAMNEYVYSVELESFSVPETLSVPKNSTKRIETTVEPEGAYVKLTYTSENEAIAKVSETGNVLGVAEGTTTITVSTADGAYSDTCEVTVTEALDANYIVVSAQDLKDVTTLGGFSGTTELIDNDELAMRLLKTTVTTGGTSGDGVGIDFGVTGANILAKEYPIVQVAYRANIQNIRTIDLNFGIDKFHASGDTSSTTSVRLWGLRPSYVNNQFSTFYFDASKATGGQNVGSPYSWSNVADDGIYTYFRLKLWGGQGGAATTAGDTFEVQYIAFFTDVETMNSFVYDTELRDIKVPTDVTVTKGTVTKLDVELEPSSAYAKLVYESENEYVARVTDDGKIVALNPGQVTINVATHDGKYTGTCVVNVTEPEKDYSQYITDRDNLENLVYRINNDKQLNVVYLGGSVTAGAGAQTPGACWRDLIGTWLTEMFPDATINNHNSAMGGSGSMLGAFRTDVDVLAHDPDLVFVEFAVNDSYSGHYSDGTVQLYYESILRQIREKSPETEIISLFVTDQGLLHQTDMSPIAKLHDAVAAHYGVSSIDVGRAMNNHIVATGAQWSEYVSDSVHPGDKGYAIYGDAIKQYLFAELFEAGYEPTALTQHTVPETYVDARSETFVPEYVEVSEDIFDSITGWTYSPNKVYSNLDTAGYIYPSANDNSFTYTFKGTGIAFYMEFNGAKYNVEYSIDGGEAKMLYFTDTNHPFNKMFKTGSLEDKEHTITFSYKGTDGTGGTNSGLKLTRLLVSKVPGEEEPEPEVLCGDVDGNGKVEPADGVALSRYNAQWAGYSESEIAIENADVDGVEGVGSNDAVTLARFLAQWAGYETLPLVPAE